MVHYGHGAQGTIGLFSPRFLKKRSDRFGYMFPGLTRSEKCVVPCDDTVKEALDELGNILGTKPAQADNPAIPAGYTYLGQFIDHDITLDTLSTLECGQNPNNIINFRTPNLDLDSVYGDGPAVHPFLYDHDTGDQRTKGIKLLIGTNTDTGPGGPFPGVPTDFDVPRTSDKTAIIGDPRNNENLIVSQLHHAFLKFHNAVVDHLLGTVPDDELFKKARTMVVHHYQWIVFHDFLKRVANAGIVDDVLKNGNRFFRRKNFQMPVEFSVAAYRMGHSMIRENYEVNDKFQGAQSATLGQVFEFISPRRTPVFSDWVVDFNRFFDTGSSKPVQASKSIDTALAPGLSALPDEAPPIFSVLAVRNLRRGLAFGLASGQCVAKRLRAARLTSAEILSNTTPEEAAVLKRNGNLFLEKTPLWYYILKEAEVKEGGTRLGTTGSRIVAETFGRLAHDDKNSFLHVQGGFTSSLPAATPGHFTMADLLKFAGVV